MLQLLILKILLHGRLPVWCHACGVVFLVHTADQGTMPFTFPALGANRGAPVELSPTLGASQSFLFSLSFCKAQGCFGVPQVVCMDAWENDEPVWMHSHRVVLWTGFWIFFFPLQGEKPKKWLGCLHMCEVWRAQPANFWRVKNQFRFIRGSSAVLRSTTLVGEF